MDKIIVTNRAALGKKYGKGIARIERAVDKLVQADQRRGLATKVVAMDVAQDMASCGAALVTDAGSFQQVKNAIDGIYTHYRPDYLLILGGPDIVPHQQLPNPAYDPDGDDDKFVPSDLPYACEAGFSAKPKDFLGPTRVVGRLPDLLGAGDAAYLARLLGTAARWKSRSRGEFTRYFAISAEEWEDSTELSVEKLFGSTDRLNISPPLGPKWTPAQLASRIHFINCHGGSSDPHFYGQPKGEEQYPIAHSASRLAKKISNGTVVAAECCYGAQIYDPSDSRGQSGICSTYLADGAYGFFGSSTTSYGPSEGNGQADLICQYFISAVLNGASLGRASLEARHRFAQAYTHLDPTDLKTILQFHLLGDPSIHPIAAAPHSLSRTKTYKTAFKQKQNVAGLRALRRERITRVGVSLQQTLGAVVPAGGEVPKEIIGLLKAAAKESGLGVGADNIRVFGVQYGKGAKAPEMKAFESARSGRMVYSLTAKVPGKQTAQHPHRRVLGLIATVQGGQLIHLRRVHSR